ncbi:MAG TPA: hypothetical protein ENJ37_02030 [Deltaproteobacteria bacterium]|nr:hypothetical protein [Deltaproteobacteria bacterium]
MNRIALTALFTATVLFSTLAGAGAMSRRPGGTAEETPTERLAGERRLVIPGGLAARRLPEPQSEGARLFSRYCGQCHNLPNPKMHSVVEWPSMFEEMMAHARSLGAVRPGIETPGERARNEIVSYLRRHGMKSLSDDDPALSGEGAFTFIWFCSTCHALADPAQHDLREWRDVIERMNGYRRSMGRPVMTPSDMDAIVEFFRTYLEREGVRADR